MEQHPRVQLCGSSTCGCSSVASSTRGCSSESVHVHGEGVGEADATHGCRVRIYKGCAGLGGGAHVFVLSLNSIRGVVFFRNGFLHSVQERLAGTVRGAD